MFKKFYLFLTLLTAFLWLGSGSAWGDPISIDPENPYFTGFEDDALNALPSGWTTSSNGTSYVDNKNNISVKAGSKALYVGANRGKTFVLIFPEFSDDIQYLSLSFYQRKGSKNATYRLGYYSSGTFTSLKSFNTSGSTTYSEVTQDYSGAPSGALMAIQINSTETSGSSKSTLYIDNVTVTTSKPAGGGDESSCANPTLGTPTILPDGVTVTWTAGGEETAYQYACVAKGATPETWTDVPGTELTLTLHGLTAGTSYDLYVRSDCGEEQSSGAKVNFTPTCPAPSYPTTPVTNKTHNSATVTWNAAEGISKYQYVCVAQGTTPEWTGVEAKAVTSVDLSGLAELTNYDFYVRSWYSETAQSAAQKTSFQTTADCSAKTIDAEHPWTENFTNQTTNAMPLCWTAAGYDGAVYVASSSSYITFSYGKALYFTGSGNAYAYAILPDFTNDLNTLQITFSHVEESSTKSGQIQFGYYKDATFTPLHTCAYSTSSSAWRDETAIVITGVPTGAKLAFGYKPNQSSYTAAVDNISISLYEAPACAAPTALAVSEIGTNSAKVTWNSEATDFALEYKKTSDEDWTAATGTIASPFTLSGLAANETEYTVRVQAICGETPSDWVELATPFETKCQANTIGWAEDFDGATALPACWTAGAYGTGNGQWNITSDAARFNARTNSNVDLTTPEITLSEAAQLQFTHSNAMATGSVYVKEGDNEPVLLANISTASSAKLEKINLTDYTGKTVKIIFRGHGYNAYTTTYFYLEDVTVIAKPCVVPAITAATATSTGAVVTWTAGDDEGQWNLQYREIAEPENSWNLVEDVTTGYEITGLEIGHNYEVQVQAYCDATHQSAWSASTEFSPICGAAPSNLTVSARTTNSATLTWEGAENAFKLQTSQDNSTWSDAIDVNAKTYNLSGLSAGQTYYVRVQNACGGAYASTSFKTWCGLADAAELPLNVTSFTAVPECWEINFVGEYSGISNNKIYFYGNAEQMAVLPAYNIELNKLSVTFGYSTSASLEFGYLDEPNGAFHAFASQPASGEELNLENEAAAVKYIAVRYTSTSAYASGSITSVQLRKTPTCLKPGTPSVTPGVGSASINWTSDASAWNLQYKTGSADWTTVAVSTKPYELSGLEQGVSYKVRVQANCGEELSDWSDEASFITDCEGIAALPWYADFSQNLSACWTIYAQDETYYKPAANTYSQDMNISGGKDGASNNVVVLPAISADLTNAVMSFEYYGSTGANYAQLEAGYVTDKADASTFTVLETLDQAGSYTEARVALATVPAGKYLAFRVAGASSQTDMRVKNLRVINAYNFADNVDNSGTLAALNGQTVDVTIERTLVAADYYNTICLPFDVPTLTGTPLEGGDLWAFKYAKVENEELLFRIIEADHIEAGVPYLIAFPNNPENIVNPFFKNVTIAASEGQKVGDASVAQFVGILKPETFEPGIKGKLFLYENNTLYWWNGDAASDLKSFRAYFNVNTNSGANYAPRHGMKARIIKSEQSATDVDNIYNNDVQSIKLLENNQVVIIRNGVKYNVQGQVIR